MKPYLESQNPNHTGASAHADVSCQARNVIGQRRASSSQHTESLPSARCRDISSVRSPGLKTSAERSERPRGSLRRTRPAGLGKGRTVDGCGGGRQRNLSPWPPKEKWRFGSRPVGGANAQYQQVEARRATTPARNAHWNTLCKPNPS